MLRTHSETSTPTELTSSNGKTLPKIAQKLLSLRGKALPLGERTLIMGVLNVTPDSFHDGGKYTSTDAALRRAETMAGEGADIIDIGGESTRPGSGGVSGEEELARVAPVIREIRKRLDTPLSIDTTKPLVARAALAEGASMVNDISGLKFGTGVAEAAAEYGAAMVLMHTSSRPRDMQEKTEYESLIDDILESLRESIRKATAAGVREENIIIDPGFGFGKTAAQNLTLLKELARFRELGRPILIGTSHKSFIGAVAEDPSGNRLEGTAATVAIGIMNGASMVRVHDVGYMKKIAQMADAVKNVN
ncbi:MAG: dihydropteroate synthase [Candidatus Dadabacteria bacterium]|nr:dihydropteroate synthase [Candidatus Dadabacteria bacterium]